MRKINWNKTFTLDNGAVVECGWQNTNYGFRHLAVLRQYPLRVEAKACYYNRTWESYEYASVVHSAIRKAFPKEADALITKVDDQARGRINDQFGMIAGIAKLGEILCEKPEEKNDWKKRMRTAGMPGIDFPEGFDALSEDEKQRRLDGVINSLGVNS